MSSARRPLLTAAAAGTLLGALWFVPSANATMDGPARAEPSAPPTSQVTTQARVTTEASADGTQLADTGSFDTTPYVIGGTFCLALGAGFVVYSVRRERLGF
ncbi:LPXTG cell wall anchor domain-containing protein [Streptomyces sp. DG2A-72]|uniref:LPXTG cell wall anchor domain-containing protein n=1 Tax=Streptomyces sp. DG2A-72 TaxID=3051386 RepID=UPI00265B9CAF|nr:LPXTG cell wall anchor domain-containing protein [Streptomyces sp. DG2A-72]MDO0935912.1 LPXTG cell wall anchor domain-containing protein [Streptomyces sp. DG2A-72]